MPLSFSLDLTSLSAQYDAGAITPSALVRELLAEIDRTRSENPIWIRVIGEDALLERARFLERARARGERLPLYGVPYAVKDNIDVAGEPTTAACPAYAYLPAESAYAVQRLEAAGAILMGKTNLDQFATGLVGTRSPYGACRNPFDPRYISGGSSSGSAVAVALGEVAFALGTDTAGSGRVPAGFCNVVGLKPTHGLVSTRGVVPACRSLDCVSVFALTVEDAASVSACLYAYDAQDPYSRRERPRPPRDRALPLRCGVPRASDLRFFGDAAAKRAYARALKMIESLGVEIVEIDYALYADAARLLYEGPWVAERLAAIRAFYRAHPERIEPTVRAVIAGAEAYSAADAFEAQYRLQALRRACAERWNEIDVLVVPTAGTHYRIEDIAADPLARNANLGYYTNFVNLLDLAAIAVPTPFRSDGLPAGVTLIGPALSDADLAQLGARLHRAAAPRLGATRFALPEISRRHAHRASGRGSLSEVR